MQTIRRTAYSHCIELLTSRCPNSHILYYPLNAKTGFPTDWKSTQESPSVKATFSWWLLWVASFYNIGNVTQIGWPTDLQQKDQLRKIIFLVTRHKLWLIIITIINVIKGFITIMINDHLETDICAAWCEEADSVPRGLQTVGSLGGQVARWRSRRWWWDLHYMGRWSEIIINIRKEHICLFVFVTKLGSAGGLDGHYNQRSDFDGRLKTKSTMVKIGIL